MTNVVCNRFHPFNFGMIAPGNHLDLDSLRAAPPARYRSMVQKIGFWRVVRACHCDKVAHYFRGNLHGIPGPRTSYAVGALIERPAEKSLLSRFLSAKRCHLAGIFAKTHGTIPSGTQRRNDNTPGPSRLVSRHCRPRLGSRPCPAGAQDERPYEVRRKAA